MRKIETWRMGKGNGRQQRGRDNAARLHRKTAPNENRVSQGDGCKDGQLIAPHASWKHPRSSREVAPSMLPQRILECFSSSAAIAIVISSAR